MDKEICYEQLLTLRNREKFTAEQVENVECFSEEEVVLKTKLGGLRITGSNMKLSDFSAEDGTIILNGRVDAIIFTEIKEKKSFIKGLFK